MLLGLLDVLLQHIQISSPCKQMKIVINGLLINELVENSEFDHLSCRIVLHKFSDIDVRLMVVS